MCTLSVFRGSDGLGTAPAGGVLLRVLVNRDEQRSRPASRPPEVRRTGARLSVFPIDPASDGTWIGINDSGLVVALLNATLLLQIPGASRSPVRPGLQSRGLLVPMVLGEDTIEGAVAAALRWDASLTAPFRIWISDGQTQCVVSSDGRAVHSPGISEISGPLMLASSGLGDELVRLPREGIFAGVQAASGWSAASQDRLHETTDPTNGALGVLVSRPDARTVSRTGVLLSANAAEVRHVLLGDDLRPSGPEHVMRLALRRAEAAL